MQKIILSLQNNMIDMIDKIDMIIITNIAEVQSN